MTDAAEASLEQLRDAVKTLEANVAELDAGELSPEDRIAKIRVTGELITQALIKVDGVQISKDAAADALRAGDRKTSRKLSVLLARRKIVVKRLNELGDRVDGLISEPAARAAPAVPVGSADASSTPQQHA